MLKTTLVQAKGKRVLYSQDILPAPDPILITESLRVSHGVFATANRTTAGTTIIASPALGQEIVLTDLIISADRVNGSSTTIQFTDGVDTEVIMKITTTDAPANIAVPFNGNWRGWKDARIEMVTVNSVDSTVALGYYKVSEGISFSEWDSKR